VTRLKDLRTAKAGAGEWASTRRAGRERRHRRKARLGEGEKPIGGPTAPQAATIGQSCSEARRAEAPLRPFPSSLPQRQGKGMRRSAAVARRPLPAAAAWLGRTDDEEEDGHEAFVYPAAERQLVRPDGRPQMRIPQCHPALGRGRRVCERERDGGGQEQGRRAEAGLLRLAQFLQKRRQRRVVRAVPDHIRTVDRFKRRHRLARDRRRTPCGSPASERGGDAREEDRPRPDFQRGGQRHARKQGEDRRSRLHLATGRERRHREEPTNRGLVLFMALTVTSRPVGAGRCQRRGPGPRCRGGLRRRRGLRCGTKPPRAPTASCT
jgi:hypothetical protein